MLGDRGKRICISFFLALCCRAPTRSQLLCHFTLTHTCNLTSVVQKIWSEQMKWPSCFLSSPFELQSPPLKGLKVPRRAPKSLINGPANPTLNAVPQHTNLITQRREEAQALSRLWAHQKKGRALKWTTNLDYVKPKVGE